ncbi:hypothetical protein Acy02nite_90340 [Actinoplanes cyaneus]|uniref:Uncharacterized protein n=1 Tax=Actinoplanes cyaneus TaxID=52696 RepID=A0A919MB29_9ACTN|nr:hypothetical protein [Actinoplanes cyaneus]MCW2144428.1 hypothetical protein [Actinoplanes cyaneus]GID71153.1 hypothetical protein Acy02nite_90340 [Actinoplanes cyaneus]
MSALSRTELLALLEFLPLHHAEDLPEQEPYDHLRTLLIGLAENFTAGRDELAFFLDVAPESLTEAIGDGWTREATHRDKSRLWYFDDDRVTIGIGPEDVVVSVTTGTGPDHPVACLPRALTTQLIDVAVSARTFR